MVRQKTVVVVFFNEPFLFLHHVMPGSFFTLTFEAGYEIVYVTIQILTSAKTFAKYYN